MGDMDDDEPREAIRSAWGSLAGFAGRYRGLGYGPLADRLGAGGPPRGPLTGAPLILDIQFGGYPQAAEVFHFAVRNLRALTLVILPAGTPQRVVSTVSRQLTDVGRQGASVVTGADIGVIASVTDGPSMVRWLGLRQPSTLSQTLRSMPELADKLAVTQFAGTTVGGQHVFGRDLRAARHVLEASNEPLLVGNHPVGLTAAYAAAQQLPFVDFSRQAVGVGPDGSVTAAPGGYPAWVTTNIDQTGFHYWWSGQLLGLTGLRVDDYQQHG
ncbi:hypothetical protein GZH49_25850 [Nocardia terpenica]|uniref:hypothetical protein n=1 Tax=Nocardia terpenica TaxID=455432 RepID=UPI002FE42BBF